MPPALRPPSVSRIAPRHSASSHPSVNLNTTGVVCDGHRVNKAYRSLYTKKHSPQSAGVVGNGCADTPLASSDRHDDDGFCDTNDDDDLARDCDENDDGGTEADGSTRESLVSQLGSLYSTVDTSSSGTSRTRSEDEFSCIHPVDKSIRLYFLADPHHLVRNKRGYGKCTFSVKKNDRIDL